MERANSTSSLRTCWVCFGTDEDDAMAWLRPCRCRGTAKWVHVRCLQRWIDEKQKSNATYEVRCPQCNHLYKIIYPPMGFGVEMLDMMEKCIMKVCPYVAAGVLMGSMYWTSVTYGAVTIMQILGHKEGLSVMEQADPIFLFIGLPAISLTLIIAKLVRWELAVLKLWRRLSSKLPFFGTKDPNSWMATSDNMFESGPAHSYTRVLVGALVFPTMSTLIGKLFFRNIKSNFQRSLMGGISYFLTKGLLKIYYLNKTYQRRIQRRVEDYDGEEERDGAGDE